MFRFTSGRYTVSVSSDQSEPSFERYKQEAKLVESFGEEIDGDLFCWIAVAEGMRPPFLLTTYRYTYGAEEGFHPGIVLLPEHHRVFIGVGEQLVAYTLDTPKRLWEEQAYGGFWWWECHHHYVIMAAELKVAVWTKDGKPLWSLPTEPPWDYTLDDELMHLTVMGQQSAIILKSGKIME